MKWAPKEKTILFGLEIETWKSGINCMERCFLFSIFSTSWNEICPSKKKRSESFHDFLYHFIIFHSFWMRRTHKLYYNHWIPFSITYCMIIPLYQNVYLMRLCGCECATCDCLCLCRYVWVCFNAMKKFDRQKEETKRYDGREKENLMEIKEE